MVNLVLRPIVPFQTVHPYPVLAFAEIKSVLFFQFLADLDIPIAVVPVADGAPVVVHPVENDMDVRDAFWSLCRAMIYWVSLIPIFCIYSFARLTSISSVVLETSSGA